MPMIWVDRHAAAAAMVAVLVLPMQARAEDALPPAYPAEARLDFDGDGKMDLAVLAEDANGEDVNLSIYLGIGDEKPDASRQPSFTKQNLVINAHLLAFERRGKSSLIVSSGCGGCSNDYATTLTIAYRHGEFVAAGVTYDWDTRTGIGSCDINFLTGKATLSIGVPEEEKVTPLKGKFRPIKIADWSGDDDRPAACGD
jgi:hypothetical protein